MVMDDETYSPRSRGPTALRRGEVTSFREVSPDGAREWPFWGGLGSSITVSRLVGGGGAW